MKALTQKDLEVITKGFGDKISFSSSYDKRNETNFLVFKINSLSDKKILELKMKIFEDVLKIVDLDINKNFQCRGIGKKILSNIVEYFTKEEDLSQITLLASGMGSHFWAKAGFVPTYKSEASEIQQKIELYLAIEKNQGRIKPDLYNLFFQEFSQKNDSHKFYFISDHLPQNILHNTNWYGKIDKSDDIAMARLQNFVEISPVADKQISLIFNKSKFYMNLKEGTL